MRLLIDARSLGQKPSGIGMYIYNFAKELNKIKECEIALITDVAYSDEIKELNANGIQLLEYGKEIKKTFSLFSYYRFVQKCILSYRPDIFWEGNNLFLTKIVNPYGRVITTIYDVFPVTEPNCYGKIYPYYFKYGLQHTIKNVDEIIYISKETKNEVEQYFPLAKTKNSYISYIIINGNKMSSIERQDYYLYIGNLEKRKGTDILLRAYEEYRKQGGNKKLVIAGKMRETSIKELYDRICGKVDGIEYRGYVNSEEKEELMSNCYAFVFPSRAEGFGMPVIEAMFYKKEIIVSDLNIFDEIAGNDVIKFDLDISDDIAIRNLSKTLLDSEKDENQICYDEVIERFSAEKLVKDLWSHFTME